MCTSFDARQQSNSVAVFSSSAGAQGTPQTVELVKVDVQTLATGLMTL
jgi:hypothetical protein